MMPVSLRRGAVAGLLPILIGSALPAVARTLPGPQDHMLTVDRVVVVMRHGIRPPTKLQPMPAGTAAEDWPTWPVAPGWLTPHGTRAVEAIAAADRDVFRATRLLPALGCPARLALLADSDQRTIATAEAYARGVAPGCTIAIEHSPQDTPDPLFAQIDGEHMPLDPAKAAAAVAAAVGSGGISRIEARMMPLLRRLDHVLCGRIAPAPPCGVTRNPSAIIPATVSSRPKLAGTLDRASTAAQILLLEYADAKPLRDVGWGRATPADIAAFGEFHALEFTLIARPGYIAARNMAALSARIEHWLRDTARDAPTIAMIAGHDTNIANLAGLLGLHWHVPGIAADDPVPGGAILLERLTDASGRHYVRAVYRAQTLEQLRAGTAHAPYRRILPIAGCRAHGVTGLCSLDGFVQRLKG